MWSVPQPSLAPFRGRRARRAQATVEFALSAVLMVTLLTGGLILGAFANDRTLAAAGARQAARTGAALGDGLGTGLSTTDADKQISDTAVASLRNLTFGRATAILIYNPGDGPPAARPPMDTLGGIANNKGVDVLNCSGRGASLACGPAGPQGYPIDQRRREYPNERPIGVIILWTFEPPNNLFAPNKPLTESAVEWGTGEAPESSAPGAVALQPSPLPGQQTISTAGVTGDFYRIHDVNNGFFDADVTRDIPVWHQPFHVINFDPDPSLPLYTSNGTDACPPPGIDNTTHPFTNVEEPPGCNKVIAQGNGYQAGGSAPIGDATLFPVAFQASFEGTLKIGRPGTIVFTIYSDDGWIFGVGHETMSGAVPNAVPPQVLVNPPPSPLRNRAGQAYDVMACLNQPSSPAQRTFGIAFPSAGSYPFMLNYFEFRNGQLTLTIGTTLGVPIAPSGLGQ